MYVAGLEPGARADRAGDDGDPRPCDGGRGDGHQHRHGQDRHLRGQRDVSPGWPARWARSRCSSWRRTVSACSCRSSCSSGLVVGGVSSIGGTLIGAAFIEFVPNLADKVSKAAPGAVYGVILIAMMFLMPAGAGGLISSLWRRLTARHTQPKATSADKRSGRLTGRSIRGCAARTSSMRRRPARSLRRRKEHRPSSVCS